MTDGGQSPISERELILVVDDDRQQAALLERWLTREGYDVETFGDGETCLSSLARLMPSAVCLDLHLPGLDGIEILSRLKKTHPHLPVLFLTANSDVDNVVSAVKLGAYDYLVKPVEKPKLLTEVRNAVEKTRMSLRVATLEREVEGGFKGIVGESPQMKQLFRQMDRVAAGDITVLIHGESGSGKELVAKAIHDSSGRSGAKFVALNCAAIPEGLIESELFGHEKGAFTGATQRKEGRFAEADGGTLFLDEIAELDLSLQAKLLRVLQERTFRAVGGTSDSHSDFRLIAATHGNMQEEVSKGRFREDLFFRIAVFELDVPPLRDREGDLLLIANHLIAKHAGKRKPNPTLAPDAFRALGAHSWPGNVRELENAIQHALVVCEGDAIHAAHLPLRVRRTPVEGDAERHVDSAETPLDEPAPESTGRSPIIAVGDDILPLIELERRAIEHAIEKTSGNLSEAGRLLGIGRTTLYRKLKQYGIE